MRTWRFRAGATLAAGLLIAACAHQKQKEATPVSSSWRIVIHGGAGNIDAAMLTPERQAEYRMVLTQALEAGGRVLAAGGESLDAVQAAVVVMEDSPLFNAGKGAVFTHDGRNELDAAIMDGTTRKAGAVAGVHRIKNPILLARQVMERTPHVMLVGDGAEAFAQSIGMPLVDPSYFYTPERWQQLQRALEAERHGKPTAAATPPAGASEGLEPGEHKLGTVGAVALDVRGHLAAATSTGGMTNKRYGRVGDSPIIGAGTYASPDCAVSGTGHGEYFIRYTVASDLCARMAYGGLSLAVAADQVVLEELKAAGGEGGVIAMDRHGNVAAPFNTRSMYRGVLGPEGPARVAVLKED